MLDNNRSELKIFLNSHTIHIAKTIISHVLHTAPNDIYHRIIETIQVLLEQQQMLSTMKTQEQKDVLFYQNLGRLFYAIAFIDNTVRDEEVRILKKFVSSTWASLDNQPDAYGTDSAFQIEVVFNWLDSEVYSAQDSYDTFAAYYTSNTSLFTEGVRQKIIKTASAIANAFSGLNKSELILLAQLNLLIKD